MILNCIIIDDEPLAVDLMTSYVQRTPFLNLIGAYHSSVDAIRMIRENEVNLIFLDIQMSELSGLEFAQILPRDTKIIFTTAYSQYAIEGYKVNALDYLLKPISYDNFIKSANKALDWFQQVNSSPNKKLDCFAFIKSEYKLIQVHFDDILYIEGVKDYIKIYLDGNKKPIMSLMNMKTLEEALPKPEFIRTHRSFIVHMTKVQLIDRFRFVFDDQYIPVSESYKPIVQQYLDAHMLA